jgi:PAS domain S-box-containing protein
MMMLSNERLQAVYNHALSVRDCATQAPGNPQQLDEALHQLYLVLEELHSAEEEIHHQNQKLLSMQQQLLAERQRYQELFDMAPDGYLVTDHLGLIQEANYAIASMLHTPQQFLLGKPILLQIAESHRQGFYEKFRQLRQSSSPNPVKIEDWTVKLRLPHGETLDVAITLSMTGNASGKPIRFCWLLRNITKQIQWVEELVQQNGDLERQIDTHTAHLKQSLDFSEVLQRITNQVRDSLDQDVILETAVRELGTVLGIDCCDTGLYDWTENSVTISHDYRADQQLSVRGKVLSMSDCPETFKRLQRGEVLQFCRMPHTISRRPLAATSQILACAIVSNHDVLGDLWLYRSVDQPFTDQELRLVRQVADQCAIALRQSRLYQAAKLQVRELERLNHLKDDFLNSVSHELRTPMTSVQMALELMEIQLRQKGVLGSEEPQPLDRYFQIIQQESQREVQLIENLLTLTRIDAEPDVLMPQRLQLQSAVDHIVLPFLDRMDDREQDFDMDIPDNLYLEIHLSYLERILMELFSNASKFSPAGAKITVVAEVTEEMVQLSVINTGVSIVPVECDRIFDRFYRIPSNDPWRHGGTGLGLALVKSLVEKLKGKVHAESDPNEVRIIIQLPLQHH